MMAVDLNILSLALLATSAVAFSRQRTLVMVVCGALFVPTQAAGLLAVYWPVSPPAALTILALTLGLSLVCLALYAVDRLCAVFCLEMTYVATLVWLIWPVATAAGFLGLALR
ncbi:MAG: hypothetical protein R6V05_12145 [Candidatus Brocadiia bacterium]